MAIGGRKDSARCFKKDFARFQIHGGHGSLTKKVNLIGDQSKVSVFGEKGKSGIVIRGAGHHQKGNGCAKPPCQSLNPLRMNLKEGLSRKGPNRHAAFGDGGAEPGTLAAGNQDTGHFTLGKRTTS